MPAPPIPADETERLAALHELDILDTAREPEFDALVRIAAQLAGCPIAAITLVDADRRWVKANVGTIAPQIPRAHAFCSHGILEPAPLVVPDAQADERFVDNPLVTGPPGIRYYAGHPIEHRGFRIGMLCVIDLAPRRLASAQRAALEQSLADLSGVASALVGHRLSGRRLDAHAELMRRLAREVPGLLYQFRVDAQGRGSMPFASEAIRTIFGVSPEDVREDAKVVYEKLDPGDRRRVEESVARSARTLEVWHDQYRVRMPGGGEQWHEGHATPQRQPDGSTLWHGYIWNTTARKATEAALLRSREQAALAIEAAGVGIGLLEPADDMLMLDEFACRLYGLGAGPTVVTLSRWFERFEPGDRLRCEPQLMQAVAQREPCALDFRVVPGAGRLRHIEFHLRPIVGDGVPGVLVCASRDVTERHEAERLQRIADAASQADQAKTQFLARVSHELRTPLNAIVGFARLLQTEPAVRQSPATGARVRHIMSAGDHLLALINDLLELTRVESSDEQLQPEPLALADCIARALALLEPARRTRRLRLRSDLPQRSPWVLANRRRLEQCLINLLSNAVNFNRIGGTISLATDTAGGLVHLHVRDTGPGMTPDQVGRLFEPFNRLGAERTRVQGSGLGLAITKRLVEQMGGQLTVSSVIGAGSQFSIALPVADPAGAPAPPAVPSAAQPSAGTSGAAPTDAVAPPPEPPSTVVAPGGRTVLYVEDNALNRLVMKGYFALWPQLRLVLVEDGAACLAAAAAVCPDLVLVDLHLPDGSGLDLLPRIRAIAGLAATPAIAVSADAMAEDIAVARRAGFDDYWTKPLDVDRVGEALQRVLGIALPSPPGAAAGWPPAGEAAG